MEVKGLVTRVTFEASGQVVLELDDGKARLPLELVTQVQNPAPAAPATPEPAPQAE
jgi:hypothetical protein